MRPVRRWLRLFFVGGLLSYRALFNWIRPGIYVATMLGSPLFQILFFAYLGRFSGLRDDTYFVVGNAVQVSAMSGVYAMTLTIANERHYGTLGPLLATPANRSAVFLGRAIPVIANGLFVSVFGFAVGALFLDFSLAAAEIPALALVVVVTVFACTGFGMLLGSFGLRARDVFFFSNLFYFVMLLVCGVNIPPEALPGWLEAIGRGMPLTHGIEAARDVVGGATLGDVAGLVWTELGIGAAYTFVAFALFRLLEIEGRRRAALEAY
jgi:ABC-2 type transport system permease protein